jgi:AraC-like DNA-binding protein
MPESCVQLSIMKDDPNLVGCDLAPPYKLQVLVHLLEEVGVSPEESLYGTSLIVDDLSSPSTRVTLDDHIVIFRNAIRLAKMPDLGFKAGKLIRASAYGQWGLGMMSSSTLRESLDFAMKYHPTVIRTVSLKTEVYNGMVHHVLHDRMKASDVTAFNMEMQLSLLLSVLRDILGDNLKFDEIRLSYPKPIHASLYKKWLECSVTFDCEKTEIIYSDSLLDKPLPQRNSLTYETAKVKCEREFLEFQGQVTFASRVKQILIDMWDSSPTIEDVAEKLHCSPRTLHRKLTKENKSFRKLLDDVREKLSVDYLEHTELSADQIADKLGYSNTANFRHAFKRWTGTTPSKYREQIR